MLLMIRDKVTGWIAVVIVSLLIIPFAFWGINYYFGQGTSVIALEVNGKEIDLQQYQRAYQNLRQQWQSVSGGDISSEQEEELKQRTIDNLIERELLEQFNTSLGLAIGDEQVIDTISNIAVFQGVDGFDPDLYASNLSQVGLTTTGFEQQIRQEMMISQLQSALLESSFVLHGEVEQLARLRHQRRDISYTILSSDELKESADITEEDIKKYYQLHGQQYVVPEQVRIAYIELSLIKIADEIEVDEESLRRYYDDNRSNYEIEGQRKFKQVLIEFGEQVSQESLIFAREQARNLYDLIQSGQSFEDAVKMFNADTDIKLEISEFGYMMRGIMEPEIDEILFNLQEGEISEPIETQAGLHILKLEKIKEKTVGTYKTVRNEVELDYRHEQAQVLFFEYSDQLATYTFESPDTLEIASEELNLPIRESSLFSRENQDDGILSYPKVISTSFSEDVLLERNNSEIIEIDDDRSLVLRVVEHLPEKRKSLEEVRDRITTRLKYDRAREAIQIKGKEIIKALEDKVSKDDIAAQYSLEWKEATAIKRDHTGIDRAILNTAFRLGRSDQGKPVYGGSTLYSGDYAIIIVNQVSDPAAETLNEEELLAIKNQLQRLKTNTTWTQFIDQIKQQAEIQIYSNNL